MSNKFAALLCCSLLLGGTVEVRGVMASSQEYPPESSRRREAASFGELEKDKQNSEVVARVHRLVNEFRKELGLQPLTLDPIISAEATEHSADMARTGGSISHRGFNQRLQDIREKIPYRAAAENVAVNVGYDNPASATVEGWKKSPEHRKNMLGEFSLTGIGIAQGKDGRYFFTQIFVQPLK
jgi:uncharacterized protein YkwD